MPRSVEAPGEAGFRAMSYAFRVAWDREPVGAFVRAAFRRFSVEAATQEGSRYAFERVGTASRLSVDAETLVESEDVRDLFHRLTWHVNTTAMRSCGDRVVVHAGAVVSPGGSGVLLPGASGAGKTSLVAGLVREGWSYLSDEAAPIDPETILVEAYPKPLSIKPGMFAGSAELLDPDRSWPISSSEWLIDPERVRIGCLANPSLIRLIVMLERDPRRSAQATALTKADAVVRLAEHVSNRAVWGGAAVATLGRVAAGAESFVLRTARPEDALRAVRELAADAAAP